MVGGNAASCAKCIRAAAYLTQHFFFRQKVARLRRFFNTALFFSQASDRSTPTVYFFEPEEGRAAVWRWVYDIRIGAVAARQKPPVLGSWGNTMRGAVRNNER